MRFITLFCVLSLAALWLEPTTPADAGKPVQVPFEQRVAKADFIGIVECETPRPLWLPYVAVADIDAATDRARRLGATVLLERREGPAGWRSVVRSPAGGELAFWQSKRAGR